MGWGGSECVFFSSRRRHTRFKCDWSSDVCSSDLGLAKYDGARHRLLKAREFHQIAGRAGRPGFDTTGYVVVQGPEHAIENARLVAKAGDDPKKLRRIQRKKPADGVVSWTEETFVRLRDATPEPLVSRMRVNHAMILNVIQQRADHAATMRGPLEDNH